MARRSRRSRPCLLVFVLNESLKAGLIFQNWLNCVNVSYFISSGMLNNICQQNVVLCSVRIQYQIYVRLNFSTLVVLMFV